VAVILRQSTRAAFGQFIIRREQQTLIDNLIVFYQMQGSWEGLAENLTSILRVPPQPSPGDNNFRRDGMPFTLIGPDRAIVFSNTPGRTGQQVSERELDQAIVLKVDEQTIGWVSFTPKDREWVPNSPEAIFLTNINRATLVSALVAVILALTLGSFLAFTMTRSLRELTMATEEIARGKLGMQVKVRSKDELGELAESFNKMSLDLERANQLRRQMTADIAHDLRSPLSVISGYAEALSDEKLPGTPEVYAILHQETQHLSLLVDDLRTLSLADAGELPLNLLSSDTRALLEWVATRHAFTAQEKGISLRVEAGQDGLRAMMDPERMAQVLDNLVSNAFRYTPPGGEVILAARLVDGKAQLQVRDNGSGIAPEDLPHVFDRFYRGDKSRSQSEESGLGLAIAKSIVEAHGGTITAESRPGKGTIFTIALDVGG
jgi:signal transduction histidine kinase